MYVRHTVPIHRLRQLSIIHYIVQKRERHVFRNIMISVQLAISIFFVGGVFLAIALLIFLVTAYKIYEMMHLNPANIVKKE